MKIGLKAVLIVCFGLFAYAALGHDIPIHQAITFNAAESALTNSSAYSNFLNTVSLDLPLSGIVSATNFMVKGSGLEDNIDTPGDVGGARSLNHFYDPTKNPPIGLTDTGWPWPLASIPLGRDSFSWGSISNETDIEASFIHIPFNRGTSNIWSWQNARDYEWLGLTAATPSERQTNLANMFRAVGQVMHLLEDTSQPQHVRNEEHLDQDSQNEI